MMMIKCCTLLVSFMDIKCLISSQEFDATGFVEKHYSSTFKLS